MLDTVRLSGLKRPYMATIALTIPVAHRQHMIRLLKLPDHSLAALIQRLQEIPAVSSVKDLGGRVALSIDATTEQANGILQMLAEVHRVSRNRGVAIGEAAAALCEAAKALSMDPVDSDWSRFQQRLTELLQIEGFGITAKASEIRQDQGRMFCEARILSDLRPVFGDDPEKGPAAMVVVHTLRISYHERGNEIIDLFVALGPRDIEKLQAILKRAVEKEVGIRAVAAKTGVPCLSSLDD
jgi:hypothetical protein